MSFLPISLSDPELGLIDPENDPITIIPNSVFGIRGVSNGANNHARLFINQASNEFTYVPEPGYHGLAQFGFRVTDGIEEGALIIVTIDVIDGGAFILSPGEEMVINGNYEDGTEVRKQDIYPPTIPYTTRNNEQIEGEFYVGSHFSGGHPFSQISNINPFYGGGTGDIIEDSYHYKQDFSNIDPRVTPNFGGSNNNHCSSTISGGDVNPASNPVGERYHRITGFNNYSTLINPVKPCHYYTFECDLYWVGPSQSTTLYLDFVEEPIAFTEHLPMPNAIRSIPFNYTSVNKGWTHISFCFEYCGDPTSTFRLVSQQPISNWVSSIMFNRMYCDNLSLKENLDPPEITILAVPSPIAHQDCPVTLTVSSNCDLCTMSNYKWFVSENGGPYSQFSTTTTPTTNITLPNLSIYSIYVTAENDCNIYYSDPIALTVEVSLLNVTVTTTEEDCHGTHNGTASIMVTPPGNIASVNWYQNSTPISTPAPPPFTMSIDKLSADNYTVKVIDIYGCENKNNFTINESRTELWPYHPYQDGKADGTAIVVDEDANIYTAGIFTNKIVFDANYGFNAGGLTNIFLLKQDQCGYTKWALGIESYSARVNDMVLDNDGNIIIAGKFIRNITFPGGLTFTTPSVSNQDGFIASFNDAGQFLWSRQIDGTSNSDAADASGICTDQNNNIYTIGSFNGASIQFLPNSVPIPVLSNSDNLYGTSDIWLAKYSNTGTLLNYISSGTANPSNTNDYGRSISYCSNCLSGQIAITGSKGNRRFWEIYNNSINNPPIVNTMLQNFGEGRSMHFIYIPPDDFIILTSFRLYNGIQKAVVSKHYTNGNIIWEKICGDITTYIPDKFNNSKYYNGNLYLTGEFGDTNNDFPIFNPIKNFVNQGSPTTDNAVLRLDLQGSFDLLKYSTGLSTESSNSIDVDYLNTGNIFYTGCFIETSILGDHQMEVPQGLTGPDFYIARVINIESDPTYDRPLNTSLSPILRQYCEKEIQIYPNPSSGIINIEALELKNKEVIVHLINSLGKVVMKTSNFFPSAGRITFDLSYYPSGIYCIELNDNYNRLTTKFVLTK